MKSATQTIQKKLSQLKEQLAGIRAQLAGEQTALQGIDATQEEISVSAFTIGGAYLERFEKLSDEAAGHARKVRGLECALGQIQEHIAEAEAELTAAVRADKQAAIESLVKQRTDLGPRLETSLAEYAGLIDEAKRIDAEIAERCRDLGIQWDPARAESLLENHLRNAMYKRFPGIHWPHEVHREIDLSAHHRALLS